MDILTLTQNEIMIKDLLLKSKNLFLKSGLVKAGVIKKFRYARGTRDEIILCDQEGNVLLVPVTGGVWFEMVQLRRPDSPNSGVIIGSLNETVRVAYNPITTTHRVFGVFPEKCRVENNLLHFYRSDHPDAEPFFSISPLWLAVPEFHELLKTFPKGDFSELDRLKDVPLVLHGRAANYER